MANGPIYQEWRDSNEDRNYPFAENTSLVTTEGLTLPANALIDAMLYPINLVGDLYVAKIDAAANLIELRDTADSSIKGSSSVPFTDELLPFYDSFGRHVGTLVAGAALSSLSGVYTYSATMAVLSSTVVAPQNQPGLRGLQLDSGELLTGEVTLVGRHGVLLTTAADGTIRIDVVGTPGNPQLLDPIVKNIVVYGDCVLTAMQTGNVADISSIVDTSREICDAKANIIDPEGRFPFEDSDPCITPGTPPVWLPCPYMTPPVPAEAACDHGGYFYFNAISPVLDIKAIEYPGVVVSLTGINSTNINLDKLADLLPPRPMGALRFGLKV